MVVKSFTRKKINGIIKNNQKSGDQLVLLKPQKGKVMKGIETKKKRFEEIIDTSFIRKCLKEESGNLKDKNAGTLTKKVLNKAWEVFSEKYECSDECRKEVFKSVGKEVYDTLLSFLIGC